MYCSVCKKSFKSMKNWIKHPKTKCHHIEYNKQFIDNKKFDYYTECNVEIDDGVVNGFKIIGSDCESIIKDYIQDLNAVEEHKKNMSSVLEEIKKPFKALKHYNEDTHSYYHTIFVYDYLYVLEHTRNLVAELFVLDCQPGRDYYFYFDRDVKLIDTRIKIDELLILIHS